MLNTVISVCLSSTLCRAWPSSARIAACVLLLLACVVPARAQTCEGQWLPGDAFSEVAPLFSATTLWDPDGAGPQLAVLVAIGQSNDGRISSVARWDETRWTPVAPAVSDSIQALAALPNGDLVAAGVFTTAGGVSANHIARWNGTVWSPLGTGMSLSSPFFTASVNALAVLPNGDLVAAGRFTTAGGINANHIARWDGTDWWPLGTGVSDQNPNQSLVNLLAVLPNGDIVAGGSFSTAGGVFANNIARWNGTGWSALGENPLSGGVRRAIAVLPNGDLVAGNNSVTNASGRPALGISRWNGTSWLSIWPVRRAAKQHVRCVSPPACGAA